MTDQAANDKRHATIAAYEKKYGVPPSRLEMSFIQTAEPDEIVEYFKTFNGPGVTTELPAQEPGSATESTIHGMPKSVFVTMADVYTKAFHAVKGRNPTPAELETVMSVGFLETRFGTAWRPAGQGSHNHGAYQCGTIASAKTGRCDCDGFLYEDSRPPPGGGANVKYAVCFKKYKNDVDGAIDLIKLATRSSDGNDPLAMMKNNGNSILAWTLGQYGNRYFESFNPSSIQKAKFANDIKAVQKLAAKNPGNKAVARAIEPFPAGRVMVYALGLDGAAKQIAAGLGHPRQTIFKIIPAHEANLKTVGGAGLGAAIGFTVAGPLGGAVGALIGYVGGREL